MVQGRLTSFITISKLPANCYLSHICRLQLHFRDFFAVPANAKQVYRPGPKADYSYGHAVAVVGYDNDAKFWLAKNSWWVAGSSSL